MSTNIAVKFIGYDIHNSIEKTFRYSNNGITEDIFDAVDSYYAPYITNSIVLKQVATEVKDDAISIVLSNDRGLDDFTDYAFEGRSLIAYVEIAGTYHLLWTGKIEKVSIEQKSVTVKGKSHFDVLDNIINPTTFTGNLVTDPYDGDEELLNKNKPRLIGSAFNIKPVLLNASKLIYGFNWDVDGNRTSSNGIFVIRDGGLPLFDSGTSLVRSESKYVDGTDEFATINTYNQSRNFDTTANMDAFTPTPTAGSYYTCFAESSFKLGSKPIYEITMDLDNSFTYGEFIREVCEENDIASYSIHSSPDYSIGGYFTSQTSYKKANQFLAQNLDVHLWFDSALSLNVKLAQDNGVSPVAHFIEAGMDYASAISIAFSNIKKNKYTKPYKSISLGYKKNYTLQNESSLAGKAVADLDADIIYNKTFLTAEKEKDWGLVYVIENTLEIESSISNLTNATTEVDRIFDKSGDINYGIDYFYITCSLLEDLEGMVLGIVPEGVSDQVDFSNTSIDIETSSYTMDNDNGIFIGTIKTLLIGDPIFLTSDTFSYSSARGIVDSLLVDTQKMTITYGIEIPRLVA